MEWAGLTPLPQAHVAAKNGELSQAEGDALQVPGTLRRVTGYGWTDVTLLAQGAAVVRNFTAAWGCGASFGS